MVSTIQAKCAESSEWDYIVLYEGAWVIIADLQSSSPRQDDCIVSAVSWAGAGNLGGPDVNLQRDAEEPAAAAAAAATV